MDMVLILQGISLARVVISEGIGLLSAYQEAIIMSDKLTDADRETLLAEINKIRNEVVSSKFPDIG